MEVKIRVLTAIPLLNNCMNITIELGDGGRVVVHVCVN